MGIDHAQWRVFTLKFLLKLLRQLLEGDIVLSRDIRRHQVLKGQVG